MKIAFLYILNYRKDVYNIFSFPVTDLIAPGYSKIIKQPMDFLTMQKKIGQELYSTIEEFRVCKKRLLSLHFHVKFNPLKSNVTLLYPLWFSDVFRVPSGFPMFLGGTEREY